MGQRYELCISFLERCIFLLSIIAFTGSASYSTEATYIFTITNQISHQKIAMPANSLAHIQAVQIPPDIRFVLFESHTQKQNVTMSYFNHMGLHNAISGNNIGLVVMLDGFDMTGETWIFNNNSLNVSVLLVLIPYNSLAPVPGGCNMEFPIEISPFLRLYYNHASTTLEYQHSNIGSNRGMLPPSCDTSILSLSYDVYIYFLPENDFSEEEYFRGLTLMQNITSIQQHGSKVKTFLSGPKTRVVFLSYPSQGIIYNIVAHYVQNDKMYQASYVPIATYGCSFQSLVDGCGHLNNTLAQVHSIICAVISLIMCIRGHHLFKGEMCYFGFLASSLIGFILLTRYPGLSSVDRDVLTIIMGIAGGLIWLAVWWLFGIPVISMLLGALLLGFLLTSTVLYTPVGSASILTNDMNYWLILSCGMLLVTIILLPFTKLLSIVATSVVGAYSFIIAVDLHIGTFLFYIVLNVVKRAVVDDLSTASNEFPFQKNDVILCSVWGALAMLGIFLQLYLERNKPPFPPAPYARWKRNRHLRSQQNRCLQQPCHSLPSAPYESNNEQQPLLFEHANYGSILPSIIDAPGNQALNRIA